MFFKTIRFVIWRAGSLAFFAALMGTAGATDYTWNLVGSGDWSTAANWNPAGGPAVGSNAYINNGGTAIVTLNGEVCSQLQVGITVPGALQVDSGNLTVGNNLSIGYQNVGNCTQSGGVLNAAYFILGYFNTGSGTCSLSAGSLETTGETYVGIQGTGNFMQSGGTHNAANLVVGQNAGGSGTYSLSGTGLLVVPNNEAIGYTGTGQFTQSGGTHNVTGTFFQLGYNSGAVGSYNLNGSGYLNGGVFEEIGSAGNGQFTQSGGTNNGYELLMGMNVSGSGGYNLSGSGLLSINYEYVGYGSTGKFIQSGGANTTSDLYLGTVAGSGAYTLSAGTLTDAGETFVGNQSLGTFTQSGGTHNALLLALGQSLGSSGTYSLSGSGVLSVTYNEAIGYFGSGQFAQTGGMHSVGFSFQIGGGSSGVGSYTLGGGTLTCPQIIGGQGISTFNFNGGLLLANSSNSNFMSGLTAAYVQGGGAIVNTNGQNITFAQSLLDAGGGLAKFGPGLLVLAGNNTYSGGTTISEGTLQVGNGGTSGSILGNVTDNTLLVFDLAGSSSQNVNVSGSGSLVVAGPGTTILPNTSSVAISGSVTINAGSGLIQSGPVSAAVVTNNGQYTISAAGLTLAGTAALTNNSALVVTGGGSVTGNVLNYYGATLSVNGATINGNLTNDGNMSQSGLAVVSGTLANAGVVSVSPGGALGGGTLTNAFGAVLHGDGAVTMTLVNQGLIDANGMSGLTLTNFSGGNAASGTLRVESGDSLQVLSSGTVANQGTINLGGAGSMLGGSPIANTGTIQGAGQVANAVTNTGTIESINGTLTFSGSLQNNAGGLITADAGSKLLVSSGLAANLGTINLTGGIFDNNSFALSNSAEISGYGTVRTGGLTNYHTITLTGATSTVNGPVTNASGGSIGVSYNPAIFTGSATNSGYIKITSTTVTWAGGLTNSGTYLSDPAANYFSTLANSSLGLLKGGNGDSFSVNGAATNAGQIDLGGTCTMVVGNGAGVLTQSAGTLELGTGAALSAGTVAINGGILLADGPAAVTTANLLYASSSASTYQGVLAGAGNSLLVNNPAAVLVLTGSNTYQGGTIVVAGTLIVASPAAVRDGTSLTVGAAAGMFFAPTVTGGQEAAGSAAVSPVPEPGALALLAAAVGFPALAGRCQRRRQRQNTPAHS
jgi:autotransporter-associated beta strand protein